MSNPIGKSEESQSPHKHGISSVANRYQDFRKRTRFNFLDSVTRNENFSLRVELNSVTRNEK